jgi:O-antigen/teichoic acid export membrane protein
MKLDSTQSISGTGKQAAAIITGKIVALLATFAIPLVLTRFLSKDEYGIFSQFYLVVFFCTSFFCMGIQTNLYYFYPTASDKNRKSLIFQTFIFLLFSAIIAICFLNIPILSRNLIGEGELSNYKTFIFIGILLLMPVFIIEPLYIVRKDNLTSVLYPPIEVTLRLTLVISLAILIHNLNSIFSGIIISITLCFIFATIYSFKGIGLEGIKGKILNLKLAKEQLKYSLPFGVAGSLNSLAGQFDKIICISFLSASGYATYSVAFYGIPGVQQIYDSLSTVYLIKMTLKHQENKPNEIAEIYKSFVVKTYSFSLPAIIIVLLYAKKIVIFLFTSNYSDAVPLFRAYLFAFLVIMLGAGIILRATSKNIYALRSYIYSGIITIPTTYFLIKYYGTWGAMSGAIFSIILPRIIMLIYEIKLLGSNLKNFFPWKKFSMIAFISLVSIIPFIVVDYIFNYGIVIVLFMTMLYLFIVSILEIKYDLFIVESSICKIKIKSVVNKIKRSIRV